MSVQDAAQRNFLPPQPDPGPVQPGHPPGVQPVPPQLVPPGAGAAGGAPGQLPLQQRAAAPVPAAVARSPATHLREAPAGSGNATDRRWFKTLALVGAAVIGGVLGGPVGAAVLVGITAMLLNRKDAGDAGQAEGMGHAALPGHLPPMAYPPGMGYQPPAGHPPGLPPYPPYPMHAYPPYLPPVQAQPALPAQGQALAAPVDPVQHPGGDPPDRGEMN